MIKKIGKYIRAGGKRAAAKKNQILVQLAVVQLKKANDESQIANRAVDKVKDQLRRAIATQFGKDPEALVFVNLDCPNSPTGECVCGSRDICVHECEYCGASACLYCGD